MASPNDTAAAANGASRSARSCALIAPWTGSTAPPSTANANQPSRAPAAAGVAGPALPGPPRPAARRWTPAVTVTGIGPCDLTTRAAPASTASTPSTAAASGSAAGTPSNPYESITSEASIWPAMNNPTVTTAPSRGNNRIPAVM